MPHLDSLKKMDYRRKIFNNIIQIQFDLVNKGRFTYQDVEEMAVFERRKFYQKLVDSNKDKQNVFQKVFNNLF